MSKIVKFALIKVINYILIKKDIFILKFYSIRMKTKFIIMKLNVNIKFK